MAKKQKRANVKPKASGLKGSKAAPDLPEEPLDRAKCTAKQLSDDVEAGNALLMELGDDVYVSGAVSELKSALTVHQRKHTELRELIEDGKTNKMEFRDVFKCL